MDLYQADYKGGIKLYVKRVFIMDDSKELLPQYLRFVRGIIDSEDLPLNVSREILQQNKVLTSIKTASVKKILSELKNIAANDKEKYAQFIAEYNRPLKEGLYGDYANRETLLDLVRFKSTKVEGLTSLAEAKERMQPEQKALYYITGGSESMLRNSPLLEIYKKKGIEVLILDDDIDEIVFSSVPKYGDIDLKAVNKSTTGEDLKDDSTPEKTEELKPLLEKIKATLGEAVKEVRASSRLADSPSVIVSDEDEPSARMRQMMRAMGQKEMPEPTPTLEINPDHEIIKKLLADPGRRQGGRRRVAALRPGPPARRRAAERPSHLRPAPQPSAESIDLDPQHKQQTKRLPQGRRFCMLLNAFDFAAIHAQRCSGHPLRGGRDHEGEQFGDFFRLPVAADAGFFGKFLRRFLDAHVVRGRPLLEERAATPGHDRRRAQCCSPERHP